MKMIDVFPTSPGVSIWPSWVIVSMFSIIFEILGKLLREIWKAFRISKCVWKVKNLVEEINKIKHGCMRLGKK